MLISVGVPTYNRPDGLKQTLDCLLRQTYTNLEIIVSDNCSSIQEVELLGREYAAKDARIRYFRQEMNKGAFFNFQFVLETSTGHGFMWLADDDYLSDNYIEECVRFLSQNPDYVTVCGAPWILDGQGNATKLQGRQGSFEQDSGFVRSVSTWAATSPRLVSVYGISHTKALKKVRMKPVFGDDRRWLAALAFQGKVKMLEHVGLYRIIGISSGTTEQSHKAIFESLGLKYRGILHARILLAKNAATNVFFQKEVFYSWGLIGRSFIAGSSFLTSLFDSIRKYFLNLAIVCQFAVKVKRVIVPVQGDKQP